MGRGVVAWRDTTVQETWGYRVQRFGELCPQLAADLVTLTSGGTLTHRPGVLELSWDDATDPGTLTIRRPDASRVVDLTIRPLSASELRDPDPRPSPPTPDDWRSGPRGQVWELYNCRVMTFLHRPN